MTMATLADLDARAWQLSWDRQQEAFLPDREARFTAMLDAVESIADGRPPVVLDLAGGTGSISLRLLRRFPLARTTLVDVDPVLLAIARASLDERSTVVAADLRSPQWTDQVDGAYDAVLTATALHWIHPDRLTHLYREIREVLRPGGVFVNADHMPDPGLPTLTARLSDRGQRERQARWSAGAALSWDQWWDRATDDPILGPLVHQRRAVFADRHPVETTPDVTWHLRTLRDAGFTETGIIWRGGPDAAVTGLR
jgi:SAM-dependent methyltransferase